jgi:hypothetical protein
MPAYAAAATLYMSPASGTALQGNTLTLDIRENSGTEPVNAVQANFTYPASLLRFNSIASSSAFDIAAQSSGGSGLVKIARGASTPVSGDQSVATVSFTVVADTGTATLAYSSGSMVVSSNTNADITTSSPGASFTLGLVPGASAQNAKITKSTLTRTVDSMDVFYRSGTNINERYWSVAHGWNANSWALSAAGMPAVAARTPGNMDVVFRDTHNNLVDRWWDANVGWNTQTLVGNGSVRGDPSILSRTPDSTDIFYSDANGNLVNDSWTSAHGWNIQSWPDKISGNPAALTRDPNSMDIFFHNTGNNLVERYWNAVHGWNSGAVVSAGGATGDPAIVSRTPGNMDVFYKNGSGKLSDTWWDANVGWNVVSWPTMVGGAPVVIARKAGTMDVFIRTSNNNLINQYWDANVGWNTAVKDSSGTVSTDPMAITRTPGNMVLMYGTTTGKLMDQWWDTNIGWNAQSWPY